MPMCQYAGVTEIAEQPGMVSMNSTIYRACRRWLSLSKPQIPCGYDKVMTQGKTSGRVRMAGGVTEGITNYDMRSDGGNYELRYEEWRRELRITVGRVTGVITNYGRE